MEIWNSPSDDDDDGEGWKGKAYTKRFTDNLKEEGKRAAKKEKWDRAEEGQKNAVEVLELLGCSYSLGMVGWEKQSGDGPFLVILLYGSITANERKELIPKDLLLLVMKEIEKVYVSKGEYAFFLLESGLFLTYKDAAEVTKALDKWVFHIVSNKPRQKPKYGRRK